MISSRDAGLAVREEAKNTHAFLSDKLVVNFPHGQVDRKLR